MGIQSSINTALGVAAIASGLTNKKQVDKAQDKLDKSKEKLAKTEKEKNQVLEQQNKDAETDIEAISAEKDKQIEENMKSGGNTYNVPKDLPTAKETNIENIADKSVSVDNNSVNNSIGSWMKDFLNSQQKINPYETEQIMGFHALKMLDSRIAAKRALIERNKRAMISPQARAERDKNGGNE